MEIPQRIKKNHIEEQTIKWQSHQDNPPPNNITQNQLDIWQRTNKKVLSFGIQTKILLHNLWKYYGFLIRVFITSQLCKYENALSRKIHPLLIKVNQTHISMCPFVKVIGQDLWGNWMDWLNEWMERMNENKRKRKHNCVYIILLVPLSVQYKSH